MKISQLTQTAPNAIEPAAPAGKTKLTVQESEQLCRGPLSHMRWWNLLLVLWSFAEEYRLAWATGFCQHILDVDIDWLRRAMHLTFQKLNAEHQNYLRSEFNVFLEMDQVCNWKAMCRGHEYWAVVCTTKFTDVRLMRSIFAWSMDEAKAKFTLSPAEILLGWMRPGDRDYVPVKPEISDDGSLCLKSFLNEE